MWMIERNTVWIAVLLMAAAMGGCRDSPRVGEAGPEHRRLDPDTESKGAAVPTMPQTRPSKDEPFPMDRFAWKRRPLVVFAPSPRDPHYQTQRKALEANRQDFVERDMVWVEVFENGGPSRAAGEALTAQEAETLRQRFKPPTGQFTLLLVGKDTTVKRRSSQAVAMPSLFEQIDQMPMRRREMQRRRPGRDQPKR
jgi:hypothetical protein